MVHRLKTVVVILGMFAVAASGQVVWFVDVDTGMTGDGLSWVSAFGDLERALTNASAGDEIWVAEGLYAPGKPAFGSTLNSGYILRDGVSLYGGFTGTETSRSQRDPEAHVVTLSGGASNEIFHVLEGFGLGTETVLDGFTITNGSGGNDPDYGGVGGAGGGMLLVGSSPSIIGCVFTLNSARIGSAVYVEDGSPMFADCDFRNNNSVRSGEGGGIYSITTSASQSLTVLDCDFFQNSVRQGHFATGNGGAIFTGSGIVLTVVGSSFTSNFGWHNGTFGNAVVGGAIAILEDGAYIESSSFDGNYSNLGSGIYSAGDIQIVQCLFANNQAVGAATCGGFDCNFDIPDIASGFGGGIFVNSFANATILQCTIRDNFSQDTAAGVAANGSIQNSILWGNTSPQPCCGEDQIPISRMQYRGNISVEYCCVEGLFTAAAGEDPPNHADFPGSTDQDPMFVDAVDHHLLPGSPAVDSGNNDFVPTGLAVDLDGLPRFIDEPTTPNLGFGTGAIVDMGAFETQSGIPCAPDLTGDGVLDFFDVQTFLQAFATQDPIADFTADGMFDFFDVQAFLQAFAVGCP